MKYSLIILAVLLVAGCAIRTKTQVNFLASDLKYGPYSGDGNLIVNREACYGFGCGKE